MVEIPRHSVETIEVSAEEYSDAAEMLRKGLENPAWDYRTIDGLAEEFDLPDYLIEHVLENTEGLARKSVLQDLRGRELYTTHDRPLDWRERIERFRNALGHEF